MSAQPVRLYDSYGHPIATVNIGGGSYALATDTAVISAAAFEALPITNAAAVPLTAAVYGAAVKALIVNETNNIRVRWDGTSPTTAVGHLLLAGSTIELDSAADIANFKAIAVGTASTISVTYSEA